MLNAVSSFWNAIRSHLLLLICFFNYLRIERLINTQIATYLEGNKTKTHHLTLLDIIDDHLPGFNGELLDIGCAGGDFVELAAKRFPAAKIAGFDVSEKLMERAKRNKNLQDSDLFVGDLLNVSHNKKYDVVTASGVLSIFDDFEKPLTEWSNWLKPGGILCIFGRFNSADIDTIIQFRNNYRGDGWEGGLTSYSCNTITKFFKKLGFTSNFIRFHLPINLPKHDDPIRTHSVITESGEKLIVNGANTVAEHFHLVVQKKIVAD